MGKKMKYRILKRRVAHAAKRYFRLLDKLEKIEFYQEMKSLDKEGKLIPGIHYPIEDSESIFEV
jgi:hypothetical protein